MTTSTAPGSAPARRATAARRPTAARRLLTVAAATGAAATVWLIAWMAGTEPIVSMSGRSPMAIGLPVVIVTALAASLGGWAALAVLERLTRHARAWWTALALAGLVASFGPILAAETDGAARVALAAMHLVVAAVLIPGLTTRRAIGGSPS